MGNSANPPKKAWHSSLAERFVPPLNSKWANVGPKHPQWKGRVKEEILSLAKYIKFLSSEFSIPWIHLKPDQNPKYNFMLWRGTIQIPKRPEIKFDLLILLSSEYPKVIPRCFLEEDVANYTGKLYQKNQYRDDLTKKTYVMICHDHMSEISNVWDSNLGIAHFFIREVHFWFAAMQNNIIREWDRLKKL